MRRVLGTCVVAGIAGLYAPAVRAQGLLESVKTLQQNSDEEAALPDIDAIERGARSPASLSYRRAPQASDIPGNQPGQQRGTGGGNTASLSAPASNAAAGSASRIEGAANGLAPPGGLYGLDGGGFQEPGEARASSIPELHTVKKGDTLWSLCSFYFGDPWRWPKLWSQNPLVTNPHWIFPGDVVRLRAPGTSAAPALAGTGTRGRITSNRTGSLHSTALVLREIGFIEANDLTASASITGSREEKIMLATGDQAYVSFAKDKPLRAGERYTVFVADSSTPVRDPTTGALLGYLVRIYGDLVVDQIAERNTARGTLVDLVDPVERGYKVSPAVRQFKRIEPRPSAVNLEARVVASFAPTRMLGPENFVVLSRGKRDGLQVGNRTFVVRRGDGYQRVMEGWEANDPNFPKEIVGELWIVDVRENAAVAWIMRSTKEIRIGETTELRKGH